MQIKPIEQQDWSAWQAIYEEAFPIAERFDFEALVNLTHENAKIHLSKLVENDQLVGLLCHVDLSDQKGFILYFATQAQQRGRGLGGKALAAMKELYPAGFILESELTETTAENETQRQARFRFYERNGVKASDTISHNMGGDFHLMRSTTDIDSNHYLEAIDMFGIVAKLSKVESK